MTVDQECKLESAARRLAEILEDHFAANGFTPEQIENAFQSMEVLTAKGRLQ